MSAMNEQSNYSEDSQIEVSGSQAGDNEEVKAKIDQIQVSLCRFLEKQYHDVIVSDLNFVPDNAIRELAELQSSLEGQIAKQSDLNHQINTLVFELARMNKEIESYKQSQAVVHQVSSKEKVMEEKKQLELAISSESKFEQQKNSLAVKSERLMVEVQRKAKSEEAMVKYLMKAIQKQEESIRSWKNRNAELRAQIQKQQMMSIVESEPERPEKGKEAAKKMNEERKILLKDNIAKCKQYIQLNQANILKK